MTGITEPCQNPFCCHPKHTNSNQLPTGKSCGE